MIDIFSLKVEEIASKIKDAQLTSVEVCEKYIERINKFEKDVKAWVHFDKKLLLEKAAEADEHRRSGKSTGPLHGIPVAVKDIVGTVDMPTECGTVIRKGKSYSQNAEIIDLLLGAGAIVMGKTATAELAYLGPPKTTNPHDYSRTPGGSSSGSAAAVASYMAPLSIGSQTGGSVIRPASYCGVVGYKPTYGLISRNGVLKTSEKLDHVGVFGRSVEDVALLAKVLIKKDKFDNATVYYSADGILEETKKGPLFEPKFIFYKTDHWKNVEKKSREAFEYFIKSFKNNIEIFKKYKKKLSKPMQDAIVKGNKHSAKEYAEAIDFMKRSYESYEEVFEDYHGVLSPSSPGVAPKSLKTTGSAEFNKVWSYLGTPCISLPLLQGESKMPLGIQLIGAKFDDHRFLGVANWLEKECNN
jgi:Asp-tRNA(Asn)/Glu-tRNA(Gln) amidotransferase A subunit family amidase